MGIARKREDERSDEKKNRRARERKWWDVDSHIYDILFQVVLIVWASDIDLYEIEMEISEHDALNKCKKCLWYDTASSK